MAQVINTNILSLNAQRNLNNTSGALQISLQRLSSGLRINSAKDDAAGLAISERFTTQIRGLNQAIRNANDGISLAQTGEGALAEINNNLQRIRELAVQSVNATNSDTDRATLDQEVQQRLSEIDRIASQTSFNGRNVLDGSFGNAAFQVGANVGETIGLNLSSTVRTADVGQVATATSVDLSGIIAEGDAAVAGSYTTGDLSSLDFSVDAAPATQEVYTATTATGSATNFSFDFGTNSVSFDVSSDGGTTTDTVTLDSNVGTSGDVTDINGLLTAINDQLTTSGVTATESSGTLVFTADVGATANDIVVDAFNGDVDNGALEIGDFVTGSVTTPGADAITTSNLVFDVDGETVTLNADYADMDALVAGLQTALDGLTSPDGTYTAAAVDADTFSITSSVAGASPATVVNNFQPSSITGADGGTQVDAAAATNADELALDAGELTIQFGDSNAINVAASTYTTVQSFVDAVNTALGSNGTASLDSDTNVMSITSGEAITIGGAQAETVFSDTGFATTGSLDDADVLTEGGANEAIQRVDAALTSTSDLRSTFGAIQNRFESTIANLSTVSENLSSSRSRILDADFAQETAALTRAQILQQAGISVLSQANAAPQSVLSLLQ